MLNAHADWRGLLLVYDSMVFGDTLESIDEVISPRFLFLSQTPKIMDLFIIELIIK